MELRCRDCIHFLPVDVFKGICHLDKPFVEAESEICERFEPVPKCKFCMHYRPLEGNKYLGMCKDKEFTYPDLIAKTCEMFEWKEKSRFLIKLGKG